MNPWNIDIEEKIAAETQQRKQTSALTRIEWRLDKIEKRLGILDDPDPEKLAKYPALKEAYEQYLLLERLIENE